MSHIPLSAPFCAWLIVRATGARDTSLSEHLTGAGDELLILEIPRWRGFISLLSQKSGLHLKCLKPEQIGHSSASAQSSPT